MRTNRALIALLALAGCSPDSNGWQAYLRDPSYARARLERSLVNPGNAYSQLRLEHYATGDKDDWNRLPEWNPRCEPIEANELDAAGGAQTVSLSSAAAPLALPDAVDALDERALIALGAQAFERYPVQVATSLSVALSSREAAARFGLQVSDEGEGGAGGIVRARMADGSAAPAVTCATCHRGSEPGQPNARLDLGAAIVATASSPPDAIAAWGPGRVDVTTAGGVEPARIPDLRPVGWLSYLQQDATVRGADLITLAIRIETLIITSNGEVLRPPRLVSLALAAYVRSLGEKLPALDEASKASPNGAAIFAAQCSRCHQGEGLTGAPVSLMEIGTDATLGLSAERGTGFYRVPSLRGVGSRGPLLHDGTLASVDALFDPARLGASFGARLHGEGPVEGHPFGLDLGDDDRRALTDYLHAL